MTRATIDRFEQRKQTRAKLIDAALQLFGSRGYEHATVDDISQAAGYSKGAYYFHFSTKDDILLELLRLWTEDRSAVLQQHAGDDVSGEAAREALAAFFTYDDSWRGVLLEFWSQATRNAEVSKRLNQAYAGWRKQITDILTAAARSDGRVAAIAPQDAASVALAAHDGYAVQQLIGAPGGRDLTPEQLAETLLAPAAAAGEAARAAAL
jgi:AcrR family transcriptional regulator